MVISLIAVMGILPYLVLQLKAIVTGNPLPNIYWTLDGEPFEPK